MRKTTLMMLGAALLGLSAQATDYYLIGGFNGWALKDANCQFVEQSEGTYVLNYKGNLTSGFKINDGTWSNDNVNFGSNGNKLEIGVPYVYAADKSSGNIEMSGSIDNPTLTLDLTAGTLTITGAEAEVVTTYALHGNFTGSWASTDMTVSGSNWVLNNLEVTSASAEFGLKELGNGSQTGWWAASSATTINATTSLTLVNSNTKNIKIAKGTYNFSWDPASSQLSVTLVSGGGEGGGEGGGGDEPTPTPGDEVVYLMGIDGDWNTGIAATVSDNCATWTVNNWAQDAEFKFKYKDNWYGYDGTVENDTWYEGKDIIYGKTTLAASATGKDVTFTFAVDNNNFKAVWSESGEGGGDEPTPTPTPGTVAFWGNVDNGDNWDSADLVDNSYTFTVVEKAYFTFTTDKMNAWPNAWRPASNADENITADGTFVASGSPTGEGVYVIEVPGTYTVTVTDEANKTFEVTGFVASGILSIDAEGEGVEYYNLQGVRVANPENGIFVRRQGGKTTKVIR